MHLRCSHIPSEGYPLACKALGAADLLDCADDIQAGTLVLCGADIRHAKLVPLAAHASVLQQPQWVQQRLRAFLPKRRQS